MTDEQWKELEGHVWIDVESEEVTLTDLEVVQNLFPDLDIPHLAACCSESNGSVYKYDDEGLTRFGIDWVNVRYYYENENAS